MTLKQKAQERASRLKTLGIATARDNAGMAQDIIDLVIDNYTDGASWEDSVNAAKDELQRRALERYGPNIRAALRKAGLNFPDERELTPDAVKELVAEQSGLDIDNLTGDGVADAIDGLLSQRLTAVLGVPIQSVLNAEGLKAAVEAGVKEAVANGTAERLLTAGLTKAARRAATWRRAGITEKVEQRKVLNAWYQKKYARKHQQVWIPR
ncbi:hypothetical protein [Variovorax arabinosiphilus]|uniref:hypothetical protein n=1 Tax=Variovorax arabinosiphilus TaxID=3053498 RepID=UPI0025776753|nr:MULTISPECIES: hypothetical protein [unclassified Variovorax]MDM0119024.1 hypothetical protein [Variovorax sp. J2L1-78]MDM0129450.1 hypothetical protein [Variovorax sp. J2L1-63]MDM0232764.1 hypothetical protein [Variovorax sp. J2R1-6]